MFLLLILRDITFKFNTYCDLAMLDVKRSAYINMTSPYDNLPAD